MTTTDAKKPTPSVLPVASPHVRGPMVCVHKVDDGGNPAKPVWFNATNPAVTVCRSSSQPTAGAFISLGEVFYYVEEDVDTVLSRIVSAQPMNPGLAMLLGGFGRGAGESFGRTGLKLVEKLAHKKPASTKSSGRPKARTP